MTLKMDTHSIYFWNSDRKETNYHIFYYLMQSMVARNELDLYHLRDDEAYKYLPPNTSHSPESSTRKWAEVRDAFTALGIKIADQEAITRILVAILFIGQVQFSMGSKGSQVENFNELEKGSSLLQIIRRICFELCEKNNVGYIISFSGISVRC